MNLEGLAENGLNFDLNLILGLVWSAGQNLSGIIKLFNLLREMMDKYVFD